MRRRLAFLTFTLLAAAGLRFFLLRSIPPGLHYDLATNLLIGSDIAFGGYRPIFITAFTGREVLFFYWLALLMRLVGPQVLTLHLAGSVVGLLTVPATYFAVRQVLAHDRNRNWLAALSAALLAGSLWHVLLSRLGYRLITEPLVQALALGFTFWGLRCLAPWLRPVFAKGASRWEGDPPGLSKRGSARGWGLMALGGAFTGLAAYTYLAARAFPIPLILLFLGLVISQLRHPRSLIALLAAFTVFALSAVLVVAPLGYFFYAHPDTFLNRISQVAPTASDRALLAQSAVAAFKMVFISGDPYERFNYPYRPIFGPVLGAFFVTGIVITLARIVRGRTPLARAAEVMLLVWIPAMLLPTILAVHEIFPSNVRAIGLIPLIFVPTARGLLEAGQWLRRYLPRLRAAVTIRRSARATGRGMKTISPESFASLVSLVSLISLVFSTSFAYFSEWGRWPIVYRDNDGDLAAAARWLNEQDVADTTVYMSAIHYRHPTIAFLAHAYAQMRWFTGAQALAIPANGEAVYIFPHSAQPPDEWVAGWAPALVAAPPGPDGEPDFRAYRFYHVSGVLPAIGSYAASPANFANVIELLGERPIRGVSGEAIIVDLYWRVLNPPAAGDFRAVADLIDSQGYHWAQGFNDSYPSEQWRPGETVITRLAIPAPVGLPPGAYRVAVTLFAPSTGDHLTTIDAAGNFAGATASMGPIAVARSPADYSPNSVTPGKSSDWHVGPLTLIGYDPARPVARPGESLAFALYWQASAAPRETYSIGIALTSTQAAPTVVLESGPPVHGAYPTDRWSGGEIVVDRHAPRLPRNLAPGAYDLRMTLSEPSGRTYFTYLGSVNVQPIKRDLIPPMPGHAIRLDLGDTISLVGYDLSTGVQPDATTLTLFWQSLAETEADYTVFVHVLDANGQIVAQRDVQPRDGSYPTSLWAEGEYVSDPYSFTLAPGTYAVNVGMYLPDSGERLGGGRIGEFIRP